MVVEFLRTGQVNKVRSSKAGNSRIDILKAQGMNLPTRVNHIFRLNDTHKLGLLDKIEFWQCRKCDACVPSYSDECLICKR